MSDTQQDKIDRLKAEVSTLRRELKRTTAKQAPSVSEVAIRLGARPGLFSRDTLSFNPQQLRALIRHYMGIQVARDEAICRERAEFCAQDGHTAGATESHHCAAAIMHGSLDAAMRLSCGEDADLQP